MERNLEMMNQYYIIQPDKGFWANKYVRSACMTLIQKYEETDSENKRIILTNQYILLHSQQSLFYKNGHTLSFEKYTAGLQTVF